MRCLVPIVLFVAVVSAQVPAPTGATVTLRGRVLAADRTPLAGAAVTFAPLDSTTTAALLATPPNVTAADGTFALAVPLRDDQASQSPSRLAVVANGHAAVALPVQWNTTLGSDGRRDRADTDVGDIVLPTGTTLVGRVRAIDGAPIADAVVVGTDHLDTSPWMFGRSNASCRAVTDKSGIFRLAGALGSAAAIVVFAPGHYRSSLAPVGLGAPLDIALRPSGFVRGRVVLADGKVLGGVHVRASYENQGSVRRDVVTRDDGSFELSIEHPGRFRLHAEHHLDDTAATIDLAASSSELTGPAADLELQLQPTVDPNEILPVRAVTAADGAPIALFRAAAVFEEFAVTNATYLEYRLRTLLRQTPTIGHDGKGELLPSPMHRAATGTVRILAPGFAPATTHGVARPTGAGAPQTLLFRLEPEATVSGRVVLADTGAPVRDAEVIACANTTGTGWRSTEDLPWLDEATLTDENGTFTLRGLGEGEWQLMVRRRGRKAAPPQTLTLEHAEHRGDVTLQMPATSTMRGRVRGIATPRGRTIVAAAAAELESNGWPRPQNSDAELPTAAVGTDGSYVADRWPIGKSELWLKVPRPPRLGPPLVIGLGTIDVPADGLEHDFDLPPACSSLFGKIAFAHRELPASRLLVVVQPLTDRAGTEAINLLRAPRSFVGEDGSYSFAIAPSVVDLVVIDLLSWLPLARKRTLVPTTPAVTVDLTLDLHEVTVQLVPSRTGASMAAIARLDVAWLAPDVEKQPGKADFSDGGVSPSIVWPHDATQTTLLLPIGRIRISAMGGDSELLRTHRTRPALLSRDEFDLAPRKNGDRPIVVELTIPPPTASDDAPPNDRGR